MPPGPRPAPPVGTARVAIHLNRGAGPDELNVFWLNLTSASPAQADLDAIVDAVVAAYNTRFTGFITSAATLVAAQASWIDSVGTVLESNRSYSDVMTGGTGIDNLASCYVINWSIRDYYRGGKPRTYLPGVLQSVVVDGRTISATPRSNLAAAAVNFMTDVNALTHGGITACKLGTVAFARHNAWLAPPVFKQYQGASVRSVMGTQRRRLGG
jgi:hypothetical protein